MTMNPQFLDLRQGAADFSPQGCRSYPPSMSHLPKGLPLAVAVGDGEAAVAAEGAGGDLDAGRGLTPLVLVAVDQADPAPHPLFLEPHRQDIGEALVFFPVGLEDGGEDIVRGEALLVYLVGPQLGGGRAG